MEDIQRKLGHEIDKFKAAQKDLQKMISTRQQLDSQLNENEIVKTELNLLKDDGLVYKSIGPILVKTELTEAKQNVAKRIEYINKELKRLDDQIADAEKKADTHRENIQKFQQMFVPGQGKTAVKA